MNSVSGRHSEQAWLETIRAAMLRGDLPAAQIALGHALAEFPHSHPLRAVQAGLLQQAGRAGEAAELYGKLLEAKPDDTASAFALARILLDRDRPGAAATALRNCFDVWHGTVDADLAITAIELLDDAGRKRDAAAIADTAIKSNPDDARLHAYAGMLAIQLGDFTGARDHYAFALARDDQAWNWHVPLGLASTQRYRDAGHADFTLFREGLQRPDLSDLARAELHFALGKAHDDVGGYEEAARHFREGNAIAHQLTEWSRKTWRRAVEARLASTPGACTADPTKDFTPIFIVGMPRSGTTLLAELLSRRPRVCNRGELPWLARLAREPALANTTDRGKLQRAASTYAAHARRDDAGDARWFIDKQPLNFRYVDLALAMFPDARVVYCQRNPRDTGLSLWMQCFLEDVQGYAYDFRDIALVMRDCERLMAHWQQRFPASIHGVRYEELVSGPDAAIDELAGWIGLPRQESDAAADLVPASPINTASLWQARQPVNRRSIDRWRHYARCIPQLMKLRAS